MEWIVISEAARRAQLPPGELLVMLEGHLVPTDGTLCNLGRIGEMQPGRFVRSKMDIFTSPCFLKVRDLTGQYVDVTYLLAKDFDAWLAMRAADLLQDGRSVPQCGNLSPRGETCEKAAGHTGFCIRKNRGGATW